MRAMMAGGMEFYPRCHGGKPGHQGEGFQIVVPKLAFAAEAAQLDHGEREFQPVGFGLLHHLAVERETWLVLRRCGGDQPAIIADRDEDAYVHARGSLQG
jgi:hypothetical protein